MIECYNNNLFLLYEVFDFESHYAKLNTGPNGNPDAVVCDRETLGLLDVAGLVGVEKVEDLSEDRA